MKSILAAAAMAVCVYAQTSGPLSTELRQSYTIVKTNLLKMAEKMPAEDYAFRPTPEIETFAQRVSHIARANLRTCAGLNGETKTLTTPAKTEKADLVAALQESFAYCDGVFNALTDASAAEMVNGRIGSPPTSQPQTRLSILWNVIRHSNEMYGYMSVYLRLKGIVPPSTSRD